MLCSRWTVTYFLSSSGGQGIMTPRAKCFVEKRKSRPLWPDKANWQERQTDLQKVPLAKKSRCPGTTNLTGFEFLFNFRSRSNQSGSVAATATMVLSGQCPLGAYERSSFSVSSIRPAICFNTLLCFSCAASGISSLGVRLERRATKLFSCFLTLPMFPCSQAFQSS